MRSKTVKPCLRCDLDRHSFGFFDEKNSGIELKANRPMSEMVIWITHADCWLLSGLGFICSALHIVYCARVTALAFFWRCTPMSGLTAAIWAAMITLNTAEI
ncbi:hypothetical protein [uncultured Ferrimonas sp.]|uniref:hypothetical protein n=1 Tax=uncultured Ferrimonas sp. TaxID=432640 RepID=UPI00262DF131|nr:hypothetical protein [uncultured Ferrimonas sp.]